MAGEATALLEELIVRVLEQLDAAGDGCARIGRLVRQPDRLARSFGFPPRARITSWSPNFEAQSSAVSPS